MTPKELDALATAIKAMTPGDWYTDPSGRGIEAQTDVGAVEVAAWMGREDAAGIVALHNAAPALIAAAREAERLRATVDAQTAIIVDLKVENAGLERDVERLRDLVHHQRGPLHAADLITDAEYAALAGDSDAVARLESYDQMRDKLVTAQLEARAYSNDLKRQQDRDSRIAQVKAIREETGCGLKEALDIVDQVPGVATLVVQTLQECADAYRAFVPKWAREDGLWTLRIGALLIGRITDIGDGIRPCVRGDGGERVILTQADDLEAAARAICAKLRIGYIPIPEEKWPS